VPPIRGRVGRPRRKPRALVADRGYDHDKYRLLLRARGIRPLIARRGVAHGSGLGRWRWMVERTIAWLHQYRRLRTRWERRADIHEGFLKLAVCLVTWRCRQRKFADCRVFVSDVVSVVDIVAGVGRDGLQAVRVAGAPVVAVGQYGGQFVGLDGCWLGLGVCLDGEESQTGELLHRSCHGRLFCLPSCLVHHATFDELGAHPEQFPEVAGVLGDELEDDLFLRAEVFPS
jgi:transposase